MSMETLKQDLVRISKRVTDYKYVDAKAMAKDNIIPFLENLVEEISEQFEMFSEAIAMVENDSTVIQQEEGERIARLLVVCKEVFDTLQDGNPLKQSLLAAMQDVALVLEECVVVEQEEEDEEGEEAEERETVEGEEVVDEGEDEEVEEEAEEAESEEEGE